MTEPRPEQCWYFGLAAPDWSLFARLALSPRLGAASWWALVARRSEPLLVVRDESLALPKRTLEVRGPGYETFIIANADTVMSRSSASLAAEVFPGVPVTKELGEHETLLSIDKARRLLGYEPEFTWRTEA